MSDSCPDIRRLEGLLEQGVSDAETGVLTRHLDDCPLCRQRLEALAGTVDLIPGKPHYVPAASTALEKAMSGLKAKLGQPRSTPSSVNESIPDRPAFLGVSDKPGYIGKFGPYEVIQVVGRGGMGVVLKAYDASLDRIVAIKVLAPQLASSQDARVRFLREARAAGSVIHDHIVAVYSVGQACGLPYLVMPFVSGGSLQDRIDGDRTLPTDEILSIGRQLASGLAAAHDRGMVHRDIKPTNILFDRVGGKVMIADFGLARACGQPPVTQTGFLAGTPQYMAPEQAMGQGVDHRADLFSLGSVLYTMCTGRCPFSQESTIAAIRGVCDGTPPSIRQINPDIPGWLVRLIDRLMEKDPDRRVQSATEAIEFLDQHRTGMSGSVAAPARAQGDSRRRWPLVAVSTGVAMMACAGLLWAIMRAKEDQQNGRHAVLSRTIPADSWPSGQWPDAATELIKDNQHVIDTAAPVQKPQAPVFTVVSDQTQAASPFNTLAQAVANAHDGGTVEARWNGPAVIAPLRIQGKSLRIRAADGFAPVLVCHVASAESMIQTDAPLVLEGLALKRIHVPDTASGSTSPVMDLQTQSGNRIRVPTGPVGVRLMDTSGLLYATNCRFLIHSSSGHPTAFLYRRGFDPLQLNNCELYVQFGGAVYFDRGASDSVAGSDAALVMHNCVQSGYAAISLPLRLQGEMVISRSTFNGGCLVLFQPGVADEAGQAALSTAALRVRATDNVFDIRSLLIDPSQTFSAALLADHFQWQGQHNVVSMAPLLSVDLPRRRQRAMGSAVIRQWKVFLGQRSSGSFRGNIVYSGHTDPSEMVVSGALEQLSPSSFRIDAVNRTRGMVLRGSRLEGVGAELELVGPGQAYERFKRSPLHQQWRHMVDLALHR